MNTKIPTQGKNGSIEGDKTGSCGTSSAFNFTVGAIALIATVAGCYFIYTRLFQ